MPRDVQEDWSYFNQAVALHADRTVRPRPDPVVTALPRPAPVVPAPAAAPATPPAASPTRPVGRNPFAEAVGFILRLFAILGLIVLVLAGIGALLTRWPRLGSGAAPGSPAGTDQVVTDYTQFRTVQFGAWQVVTGWRFAQSGDTVPFYQYCYVSQDLPAGQARFDLGARGTGASAGLLPRPDPPVPGLSDAVWAEAATKCQWHR